MNDIIEESSAGQLRLAVENGNIIFGRGSLSVAESIGGWGLAACASVNCIIDNVGSRPCCITHCWILISERFKSPRTVSTVKELESEKGFLTFETFMSSNSCVGGLHALYTKGSMPARERERRDAAGMPCI